jgi:[CysO sulfur-carrier protein]-S-L-cysteine hydrolase
VPAAEPGFAEPRLRLSTEQYRTIVAHCYDGLPDEACGMLAGPIGVDLEPTGVVTAVYPCTNTDRSARTYTVDPNDMFKALNDAQSRGAELVGVWHSHTHSDPYPSDTDVRKASEPYYLYVIVSLQHAEPVLRCYRIRDAAVRECEVVVSNS